MKYTKIFFAALLGIGMTACSLDRTPLDPNTDTNFNKDAVFAKCYATFGTTGQKGPDGNGDVDGIDEGTSSFYRMFWELNEFCTDEGWWIFTTTNFPLCVCSFSNMTTFSESEEERPEVGSSK